MSQKQPSALLLKCTPFLTETGHNCIEQNPARQEVKRSNNIKHPFQFSEWNTRADSNDQINFSKQVNQSSASETQELATAADQTIEKVSQCPPLFDWQVVSTSKHHNNISRNQKALLILHHYEEL